MTRLPSPEVIPEAAAPAIADPPAPMGTASSRKAKISVTFDGVIIHGNTREFVSDDRSGMLPASAIDWVEGEPEWAKGRTAFSFDPKQPQIKVGQ